MNSLKLFFIFLFLTLYIIFYNKVIDNNEHSLDIKKLNYIITNEETFKFINLTRDFIRYNCKNMVRIGGPPEHVLNAPHDLFRIDGAWFICLDKLEINNCTVLSFGINTDYSFDRAIRYDYGCKINSFDPFIEADLFKAKRESNISLKNSFKLEMDEKWTFYRIGIVGQVNKTISKNEIGSMTDIISILKLTNQLNKTIDIFKMDTEGGEKEFIENLDMNYACTYFKQFVIETHLNYKNAKCRYDLMKKLEICFSMFHRNTRFFRGDTHGPTGLLTEFQNPKNGFKLELNEFVDEFDLVHFLFSTGELYFINRNFFP